MRFRILLVFIVVITMISSVSAVPEILDLFNIRYNTFKTKLDSCNTCHTVNPITTCETNCHTAFTENAMDLNPYGYAVKKNLRMEYNKAFRSLETLDSDNDKVPNINEIINLTNPGDKRDFQEINNK